ncbi:hypothetical protein BH09ACT1_BH09ACT1_22900 [soil metagenome]
MSLRFTTLPRNRPLPTRLLQTFGAAAIAVVGALSVSAPAMAVTTPADSRVSDVSALPGTSTVTGTVGGQPALVTAIQQEEGYLALFSLDESTGTWTPVPGKYTLYPDFSYSIPGVTPGVYKLQAVVYGEPVDLWTHRWTGGVAPAEGPFSEAFQVGTSATTVKDVHLASVTPSGAATPIVRALLR